MISDNVLCSIPYMTPIGLLIAWICSRALEWEDYCSDIKKHLQIALTLDIIAIIGLVTIIGSPIFFICFFMGIISIFYNLSDDNYEEPKWSFLLDILDKYQKKKKTKNK